jgi:RNA polymerase-binding transcription factor DksA
LARLTALPYAMTCIDCQRAAEAGGSVGNSWATFIDSDMSYSDLES